MTFTQIALNLGLIGIMVLIVAQLGASPAIGERISSEAVALGGHVILYFFVGLLLVRFAVRVIGTSAVTALGLTAALILVLGICDEVRQTTIDLRTAQFSDVVADLAGGLLGSMVYLIWSAMTRPVRRREVKLELGSKLAYSAAAILIAASAFAVPTLVPPNRGGAFESFVKKGIALSDEFLAHYWSPLNNPVSANEGAQSETRADTEWQVTAAKSEITPDSVAISSNPLENRDKRVSDAASVQAEAVLQMDELGIPIESAAANFQPQELKEIISLRQRLAQLEIQDLRKFAYSPNSPHRAWLRQEVNMVLGKISDLQKDVQSPILVSPREYLRPLKRELARLEVQDTRLIAYSGVHPKRLLLQEKTDYLREKIEREERTWNCARPVSADNDQYVGILKREQARLEGLDRHMERFVEDYPPRILVRQQIETLERKITRTIAAGSVCSIPARVIW